ncbi:MAG: hypothetical protein E5Y88_12350 [Mesorhizobium sp.]|uniref:hypothetical protein n=1 Tax=Mesorhizobium sp. TaxID=1871066 RepID=UPI00121903CF|nr:hypothetical protein [Mesorhizobium sp.]TIL25732.1 MAG: hypothetical protein E5Y88_12350 [Mesorhizobium sp.]
MSNFVLIENGVVVQSDRTGGTPKGFIEAPEEVHPGYLFDGQTFTAPAPRPPSRAMVLKSVVQARIIEAGKMAAAYAALTQNPIYFARWFAPDRPEVYCDDSDAIQLVTALGLDPDAILAPARKTLK